MSQGRYVIDAIPAQVQDHEILTLVEGINRTDGLIGQDNSEHNLRREFVGDGFEHREGKFATYFIFIFVVLGKIPKLFDFDIGDLGS